MFAPGVPHGRADSPGVAWRSAFATALIVIGGELAFGAVGMRLFGLTDIILARAAHILLSVLVATVLLVRPPSIRLAVIALYVLAIPLLPIFWMAEAEMATAGLPWAPFVGHKLVVMGLAILMPGPLGPALVLVATFPLLALVQWFVMLEDQVAVIAAGEPWVTVIYGVVAMVLVAIRAHHRRVVAEFARSQAEAEALQEVARFLLAIRDMSNTPLQALEIDVALLERQIPEAEPAVRRMHAALDRLRETSGLLARYDHLARWHRGEESFDPEEARRWLERAQASTHGAPDV